MKIKMSDENCQDWPSFLTEASPWLEIEPERKLCQNCDYLYFKDGVLRFHSSELGAMCFNFAEIYQYHRRQHYALSKEPLAKAIGLKGHGEKKLVWDATCGTGKDALLIHHFGAKLLCFERNPIIFLLLKDALRRFPLEGLSLFFADAKEKSLVEPMEKPDVIYYDPMYPEKKKSALPRKEMRIFKEMVGEDLDSSEFLEWALQNARERVVVKRPISAEAIKEKPTASYLGKSTRYDMYKIF